MIEHIGSNQIARVGELFETNRVRSCFVVADPVAYEASGAGIGIRQYLETIDHVTIFKDFSPNPDTASVERAYHAAVTSSPDCVLAIGGGTAIDIAKLVSCALASGIETVYANSATIDRAVTLVAIPTTAGTGSEATHFAVLYIDGVKHSIAHPELLPDACIVDPELLISLPSRVAAHAGLDALCQSIESIWSVNATEESIQYATEGLQLATEHFENAVCRPDPASRDGMARSAHLSGKAINIGKTTAPHAISYTLTSRYGIPHGLAVALTIGRCLEWNAEVTEVDCVDPKGSVSVKRAVDTIMRVLSCGTPSEAARRIDELVEAVGCSSRLGGNGVTERDLETIAASVNAERLENNPRRLTQEKILHLLRDKL